MSLGAVHQGMVLMTLVANVGEAAILSCTTFLFVECKTNLLTFFHLFSHGAASTSF